MNQEIIRLYELNNDDISNIKEILYKWSYYYKPIILWKDQFTIGFSDDRNWYRGIAYKMKNGYHIDIVDTINGDLYELK